MDGPRVSTQEESRGSYLVRSFGGWLGDLPEVVVFLQVKP